MDDERPASKKDLEELKVELKAELKTEIARLDQKIEHRSDCWRLCATCRPSC
jgi:hypothetical protein